MKRTDKRNVLRRMARVREVVSASIAANREGGKYARGLASEGFDGGYLQALDDIEGALRHGYPSDHRGYWKAAEAADPLNQPQPDVE